MLKIGIRNGTDYKVGLVGESETISQILVQQNINPKFVNVFVNGTQVYRYDDPIYLLHKESEMLFLSVKSKFFYE